MLNAPGRPGGDEARPWRRLASAILLQACVDAYDGDVAARLYLCSPAAHQLAGLLGLPTWPPSLAQLNTRMALSRRAHAQADAP